MIKLSFKLARKAKGRGGDRYEAEIETEERPVVVYLPQSLTRVNGKPVEEMEVMLNPI